MTNQKTSNPPPPPPPPGDDERLLPGDTSGVNLRCTSGVLLVGSGEDGTGELSGDMPGGGLMLSSDAELISCRVDVDVRLSGARDVVMTSSLSGTNRPRRGGAAAAADGT